MAVSGNFCSRFMCLLLVKVFFVMGCCAEAHARRSCNSEVVVSETGRVEMEGKSNKA